MYSDIGATTKEDEERIKHAKHVAKEIEKEWKAEDRLPQLDGKDFTRADFLAALEVFAEKLTFAETPAEQGYYSDLCWAIRKALGGVNE